MASLSLSDLLTADTEEQAFDMLLVWLQLLGFEPTSWHDGAWQKTVLRSLARVVASVGGKVESIARGGYLATAIEAWLDLLIESDYDLERKGAVTTKGRFRFDDAGGGDHEVQAGQLLITGPGDRVFRNTEAGTIPLNGWAVLAVEAVAPGASYNLLTGSALSLTTSLPTVVVTNPGHADLGGGWISRAGADRESDDSYRARARARWPGSGRAGSGEAYLLTTPQTYEAAAITVSPEVTRARAVPHQPSPGDVLLVLGGAAGPVSQGAIDAVAAALTPRVSAVVHLQVQSVVRRQVPVVAQLRVQSAYAGQVVAAAQASLQALQASYPFGPTVYPSAVIEALMLPPGMVDAVLTSPKVPLVANADEVVEFVPTFTVVPA